MADVQSQYDTLHSSSVTLSEATPMVRQFLEVKQAYPGVVLLYRMGDFYETFFEDAVIAAKALEITLTGRDAGKYGRIPMAGIPVRALESYLPRLLGAQFKVAICEQIGDPALSKGLVERKVVRVLSAGTVTESQYLKAKENNFLAAISYPKKSGQQVADGDRCGFAFCDVSTGEFWVTELPLSLLPGELERVNPSEVLVQGRLEKQGFGVPEWVPDLPAMLTAGASNAPWTPRDVLAFDLAQGARALQSLFQVTTLEGFNLHEQPLAQRAAGAIAEYIRAQFIDQVPVLNRIQTYRLEESVYLSPSARRNLELLGTVRDNRLEGSLLWALDQTVTNMGGRLLRQWISQPLKNLMEIHRRQEAIDVLLQSPDRRASLRQTLSEVYDLERLASKVANLTAMPRDLIALKLTLDCLPMVSQGVSGFDAFYLTALQDIPEPLITVSEEIGRSISPQPPVTLSEGGILNSGYDPELDRIRQLVTEQEAWLAQYEQTAREQTGIKSLKVSYNQAFGYFIEVSKANVGLVPDSYIRRQTLTNAERYTTPELKAQESLVMEAMAKRSDIEYQLYVNFRARLAPFAPLMKEFAQRLAALDVLLSLATVAAEYGYVCPVVDESTDLEILDGRHPVVERMRPLGTYVSNPCHLSSCMTNAPQMMVITGPNMAGKSTYMRQVALLVLMAQMGSFVPAAAMRVGWVDAIYTRIGAVDDLSAGQSTFMVEMTETAQILNQATERSLVILDEVGRGTSTFDGVAIAWSVAEYLALHNRSRTLFATHYHELNALEKQAGGRIRNYRICVSETHDTIEFLHRIEPGMAQKSYGIQVARMAGVPAELVARATTKLHAIYKKASGLIQEPPKGKQASEVEGPQSMLVSPQLQLFQSQFESDFLPL